MLILALSGIGNMVNATPLLAACRNAFPEARVHVAVAPRGSDAVISGSHLVDDIVVVPAFARKGLYQVAKYGLALRTCRFGIVIICWASQSLASNLLAYLSGAGTRVGYASKGSWLLTHVLRAQEGCHEVELNRDLLRAIGTVCMEYPTHFEFGDQDVHAARRVLGRALESPKGIAALHPGSYADMTLKRWAPERFAELGDRLVAEVGMQVAIMGGPEEKELAQQVAQRMRSQALVLAGSLSLKVTAAALSLCRLAIANCSGLMHVAAAVGTPTVAVYGPTDPRASGPFGNESSIVRLGLDCSPCYTLRTIGRTLRCPYDVDCLRMLDVDRVFRAAVALYERNAPPTTHGTGTYARTVSPDS